MKYKISCRIIVNDIICLNAFRQIWGNIKLVRPDLDVNDIRYYRLSNIDMLRGLVLVIMVLDHVREFFIIGQSIGAIDQPDVSISIYLTRWITNLCAPAFVFLAGTSIGLMSARRNPKELASFIFKRGVWLVFIEITVISMAFSFAPFGDSLLPENRTNIMLQVIWVIGLGMIVLSGLQFFGKKTCLIIAVIILLGHNMLDTVWPGGTLFTGEDSFWIFLFVKGSTIIGPFLINGLYPVVPWIAVLLFGYGTSSIFEKRPADQNSFLLKIGSGLILAFLIVRYLSFYGDPNPWEVSPMGMPNTILDFINVSKYPPSLLYLLITLGLSAVICSRADKWNGWLKDTLVMFGRVPFAFYVVHFYLVHLLSILFGIWQGFEVHQFLHMFNYYPASYGTSLFGVYIIWIMILVMLYPFCKWVSDIKRTRKDWWLSYL